MSSTLSCDHVTRFSGFSIPRRRPSLLARFLAAVAREIRIRRDMRLLASFDEAALRDIGLTSGGVEHIVRHGRPPRGWVSQAPVQTESATIMPSSFTEWR